MKFVSLVLVLAITGQVVAKSVDRDEVLKLLKKLLDDKRSKPGEAGQVGPGGSQGPEGPPGGGPEGPAGGGPDGPTGEQEPDAFGSGLDIEPPVSSGSGSSEPGLEEFKAFLLEQCKLNFDEMMADIEKNRNQVDAKEYAAAMTGFAAFARKFSNDLLSHEPKMENLEQVLEGGLEPNEIVTQHGDLLRDFLGTLEQAMVEGVCAKMSLFTIRMRMDTEVESHGWDHQQAAAALMTKLDEVGKAIRTDVKCLIHDVGEFTQSVMAMPTFNLENLSARKATMFMDMAVYHLDDISMTVFNLNHSAEALAHFLGYQDSNDQDGGASQSATGKKKKVLLEELKSLTKILKKLDMKKLLN